MILTKEDFKLSYNDKKITCIALFASMLIICNILATKTSQIGFLTITSGTILFPFTYLLGDVITEEYGEKVMMKTVLLSLFANLIMIVTGIIAVGLPYPSSFTAQPHFEYIFTFVPRIVLGSYIGCYCGQYVNARMMTIMKEKTNGKYLFARTIGSTIGGELVDTILFLTIGFLGTMSFWSLCGFVMTQYITKVLIETVLQPVTYEAIKYVQKE